MRRSPPPHIERYRIRTGPLASDKSFANNGAFLIPHPDTESLLAVVVSDGAGWEHASVHVSGGARCPIWQEMCFIKDAFWQAEERVVQYHPPRREYVNVHEWTLHLWRPTGTEIPAPPPLLVGPHKQPQAASEGQP